jgi:hypothetical protein
VIGVEIPDSAVARAATGVVREAADDLLFHHSPPGLPVGHAQGPTAHHRRRGHRPPPWSAAAVLVGSECPGQAFARARVVGGKNDQTWKPLAKIIYLSHGRAHHTFVADTGELALGE